MPLTGVHRLSVESNIVNSVLINEQLALQHAPHGSY